MTDSRRATKRLLRVLSASAGAGLLLLIAPHVNPWQMEAVRLEQGRVAIDALGASFVVSLWVVTLAILAAVVVSLASSATCRAALAKLVARPARAVGFLGALVLLLLSLIPTGRGKGVVLDLALGTAGMSLLLAGLPLLRLADRIERPWNAVSHRFGTAPSWWLLLPVFGFVFLMTNLGSWLLFGHLPHIVDGMAQAFHAKIFLAGQLTAPPPPAGFFELTHMIDAPRWYSQYPPGHSLLLAAGQLFGVPWLVNPLFGALSVVLLYFIGREAYGEPTGRLALLLGALSPFLILVSSSFMNHTTTLFFLELFLLGFIGMRRKASLGGALLAGFGLGYALSIRPLTVAAFAIPWVLYAVVRAGRLLADPASRGAGARFLLLCLLASAAFAVPAGGLLAFNHATNGDPLLFGYEVLHGKEALPGFGKQGWSGVPHTPGRGLDATLRNANSLNRYLFGLPFPSLLFALLGLAWIRLERWDLLLVASVGSVAAAYFFYWYQDLALGPRFLYSGVGPLVLLSARGLLGLPDLLAERERAGEGRPARALGLALALALAYAAVVTVPAFADYYARNFANGNRKLPEAFEGSALEGSVVFVPPPYYPSLFPQNDPWLAGPVVYARDLGPSRNRDLLRRFPGRSAHELVALERYTLRPYTGNAEKSYAVVAGARLTIEATAHQAFRSGPGGWRNLKMGDHGGGWKNHDQLVATSGAAGAAVGFVLEAERAETRTLTIQLGKAPDFGIVTIGLNGRRLVEQLDLYSSRVAPTRLRIPDVRLGGGVNRLLLLVTGRNKASRGYGLGLDYVSLE